MPATRRGMNKIHPTAPTKKNLPAAETQEQTIDSEHDEADGSETTVTPNENQQGSAQTTEMDSQPVASVETDEESHSSNVEDGTVTEADDPVLGSKDGVVTPPDEVVVDVPTEEPTEATVTVNTAAVEALQDEAADAIITNSAEETIKEAKVPLTFGVIDEVYNFVDEFQHSQSSDAEQTSASPQDSAGGVPKAALFEHPPAEGYARIQYEVTLPQAESNENLIFTFQHWLERWC